MVEVRTSRLQEIVKVPQVQVIDEVAKVPMIQEMQKDQKPDGVQISFKVCVDRGSGRKKRAPHSVLESKAGWTKQKWRQRPETHEEQS